MLVIKLVKSIFTVVGYMGKGICNVPYNKRKYIKYIINSMRIFGEAFMAIKLADLLEKLSNYELENYRLSNPDVVINMVKKLERGQSIFESDVLYVGKSSEFPKNHPDNYVISILCKKNSKIPNRLVQISNINLIILKGEIDLLEAFDIANNILNSKNKLLLSSARILESLANSDSLQCIAELAQEILGSAICITSKSLKVLAISKNMEASNSKISSSAQNTGYFPQDYVLYHSKENLHELIDRANGPFFWINENTNEKLIFGKIMINKRCVGVLSAAEFEKPLNNDALDVISMFCAAASVQMQKSSFYQNTSGMLHEDLIIDLLEGSIKNIYVLKEKIKYMGFRLKKFNYVLVIEFSYFNNEMVLISYIQDMLIKLFFNCRSAIYDNHIVTVISTDKEWQFFKMDLEKLNLFMKKNNLQCGLSRCFNCISRLQEYYLQALNALRLGKYMHKDEVIYLYEDYALFHIMDICSKSDKYTKLCHPCIFTIMEYDHLYNTTYIKSLYSYVINLKNISGTASSIHTHRNTIIYRIKKIEEIANIDMNDNNVIFQLFLSFKLIEYSDKETARMFL
jgi:PucR family transcriptional regulator, proline-responsive transcriptional activator